MESPTELYKRQAISEGKFRFYSTCSPDLFFNGIEVEIKMTYNPQQCKSYLKSQLQDKIDSIDNYDLLIYLSGGIPFLGGTFEDMYSSKNEFQVKPYIYGILTRPISEDKLNASYPELCNISKITHKLLISPICESTENGLIDMACILGYLNHDGLLSNKFLKCCSTVTHFPPLITCLKRIIMQNNVTGRDVVTVTSSLYTFFRSLIRPIPREEDVFNYAIMCCNYIININVKNDILPMQCIEINQNDRSVQFLINLKQPRVVYFWKGDECGTGSSDYDYCSLKPFDLKETEKLRPKFISFMPIPPLSIRNDSGCSIVKGKNHNYFYLTKSSLKNELSGSNVDIIDPLTGIIESIDIEKFAIQQENTEIMNEFESIDPERVSQVVLICLDSSSSMSLTLEGNETVNGETKSLIAIQYLLTFAQKIHDYKIKSIQGLINFNSKVEFCSQFSPLSDKIDEKSLFNISTNDKSFLWDALSFACDELIKFTMTKNNENKFKNAVKRVFIISSGEDQGSETPFIDVAKKLIDNNILVDSFILNNEENGKQLCALCHMTSGLSFNLLTVNDGLRIAENSDFINSVSRVTRRMLSRRLTTDFIQKTVSGSIFDNEILNKFTKSYKMERRLATPRSICSRCAKSINLNKRYKRILKEIHLAALNNDQSINPNNDGSVVIFPLEAVIDVWHVFLKGCDGTLYEGKWFKLLIVFPILYPMEPPVIRFLNIPYHLNVSPDGIICIDILNSKYLPSMHIIDIIYNIKEIFLIPDIKNPAQIAIFETFINDQKSYQKNVNESVLNVGKDDYKEFFTDKVLINDSVSNDFTLNSDNQDVPAYAMQTISGRVIKDPVLSSSGVYYEREELRQLIASHINPICVITGKSLTEKLEDIDNIGFSNEMFHKNSFETKVKSENIIKYEPSLSIKTENLTNPSLIDRTDLYKLIKFKERKTGEFYAAAVFYQNIENYSTKKRKSILKWLNKMININHPSIIRSIKFERKCLNFENQLTLFTEFVDQISLKNIILKRSIKLNDTQKLILIFGIASAMSYLHSRGILHRDLTIENIYVDRNFYPKLTNIGMINVFKGLKSMEKIPNLSFYQAPEFYFENKYTKLSDVYSFALMIYEILSNENLFNGISFTNHLNNMENMWRPSLDKKIPEAYHSLIKKCWSQNPNERPSFKTIMNELNHDVKQKIKKIEAGKFNQYISIIDSIQREKKEENNSKNEKDKNVEKNEKDDDGKDEEKEEEEENNKGSSDENDEEEEEEGSEEESFEEEEEGFEEEELNEFEKKICEDLKSKKVNRIDIKLYKKEEKIDNGGFGTIYKATKKKQNLKQKQEELAVKIFSINVSDPKTYENISSNFINELILHSSFSHPSIVKFIGFSPLSFIDVYKRHNPLMIIKFAQNGSLYSIIKKIRLGIKIEGWNDTKKLIVIYGIAASMSYLHSKEILHRDLKPQNVLIDNNFFPKLTDFGISIEISKISCENSEIKGTTNYIAPEIWREMNYSKSSDVYSFGILVYEMMANDFIFKNVSNGFICYQIASQKYRPKIDKTKVPQSYIKLINLCWSDDLNKRPSFDMILKMLKEDEGFTKDNVDLVSFTKYVSFVDEQLNHSNL